MLLSNTLMGAVLVAVGMRMIAEDEDFDNAVQNANVADAMALVPNVTEAEVEHALNSLAYATADNDFEHPWQHAAQLHSKE
ncbi:hypothetical protein [Burkholderia phage BCSR5]|nr:hypothetical protein [Burkholderia phage BCSR5]